LGYNAERKEYFLANKYKVRAILTWEIDSDSQSSKEIVELARKQLEQMIQGKMDGLKSFVSLDKKTAKFHKEVLGEFDPDEVFKYLLPTNEKREYKVGDQSYFVKMNSHRYFVFLASRKCAACHLEGTKMLLEKHPNDKQPHFNLYAVDDNGQLVLMTKDHIQARSAGGEDRHSNYQCMCSVCNNLKGDARLSLESIRQLRKVYDENKDILPKKKLASLIHSTRSAMIDIGGTPIGKKKRAKFRAKMKKESGAVFAKSDINILKRPDGTYYGMSVYDSRIAPEGEEHIGSVRKGSFLKIINTVGNNGELLVEFGETSFTLFHGLTDYLENLDGVPDASSIAAVV
jgi:hypothetical protein